MVADVQIRRAAPSGVRLRGKPVETGAADPLADRCQASFPMGQHVLVMPEKRGGKPFPKAFDGPRLFIRRKLLHPIRRLPAFQIIQAPQRFQ